MLVSVVVATYHRENELYNALSSLTLQTYDSIEIIVVDDNAEKKWNDKVALIIQKLRKNCRFPLRYIVNETNMGSAKTRNLGIEMANGSYITFLDDDDTYLPEKVEKQLMNMVHNDADFSLTDLLLYDQNECIIDRRIRNYIKGTTKKELLRYHLMYHMTGTDTFMFKTEYLKKIGGFQGIDVGDEFYLMMEAILNGGKFSYLPECYVKAYIHMGESTGLSSGQGKIEGENILFTEKEKYFDYLDVADIRYIKSRHYAVIAFAELRRKEYISFFRNAIMSFISSPIGCLRILHQHKRS